MVCSGKTAGFERAPPIENLEYCHGFPMFSFGQNYSLLLEAVDGVSL